MRVLGRVLVWVMFSLVKLGLGVFVLSLFVIFVGVWL